VRRAARAEPNGSLSQRQPEVGELVGTGELVGRAAAHAEPNYVVHASDSASSTLRAG
jgi:hypothetical protein